MATENDEVQQYAGDDVSALVLAKQRMAERDAEYSAKFNAFASSKSTPSKLRAKKTEKPTPVYSNEGKSVPAPKADNYSNEGKSVPVASESPAVAPPANAAPADADPAPVASKSDDAGSMSFKEVSGGSGLRSLNGGSTIPDPDRAEFSKAFNS